ncbi:MAG: hypothetical protein AVDCRST_MAG91-2400 [uncultured Sphingomonadaceae bacterium]|uniref:Homogentisate 1,2-dioxygenase n=1 Tax=uncultured Sphingomonadaceae bacterium TaxID=169976 RepID=A0A6J4TIQ1_9SPHN|nr:MAG: hypothetical protein AVDCRST_MAG91-2400 [uncultured Sphingomonadaceae bacterium]
MKRMLAGLLLGSLSTVGGAQDAPKPACAAVDAGLPDDLVVWKDRASLAGSRLAVGRAMTVRLRPIAAVQYAAPPERPGAAGTYGATLTLDVARAGTYRVALSDRAWVDLVATGRTIASTAHGHGPACSSIRKIVSFPLRPGRHTLQLGGNAKDRIAVLVTPAQ